MRSFYQARWWLLGAIVGAHFAAGSDASAGDDESEAASIKKWRDLYLERAVAVTAVEHGEQNTELMLVQEALQSFANPVRPDSQHGTVHLWINGGRPRVIGAVWTAFAPGDESQRRLCYEFHSLSAYPLTVTLQPSGLQWTPREAGVEWIRLKDVPAPSSSRTVRMTQMRRILHSFILENDTNEAELRLLTQPIYRYPSNVEGAADGAVFSFVMGTDPELFLLIEARQQKGQRSGWWIAPARLTGTALSLQRNGLAVWESPTWENFSRERVYDFLYGVESFSSTDMQPIDE